jgi:twitching motility two-component system response regulator PilG
MTPGAMPTQRDMSRAIRYSTVIPQGRAVYPDRASPASMLLNFSTGEYQTVSHVPQKVILVVDDSKTVRNIMALILHRLGHRTVLVASAMEALSTLTTLVPDLIFLDITLPGMDGLDVCKVIKENNNVKHVPVVMLSGNDEVFDKVIGRLAGASDYLTKPFEPETIVKCIDTYCGAGSQARKSLWKRPQ